MCPVNLFFGARFSHVTTVTRFLWWTPTLDDPPSCNPQISPSKVPCLSALRWESAHTSWRLVTVFLTDKKKRVPPKKDTGCPKWIHETGHFYLDLVDFWMANFVGTSVHLGRRSSYHPLTPCSCTYFTHARTCDNVRVQCATQWTASVHTLHMPKPVITFVLRVLRNGLLRYILYTCPSLW